MATSCPDSGSCGTSYPGWLDGNLPTVKDEEKTLKVYFRINNCKAAATYIRVRNCGAYTIYRLVPSPGCTYRYCGTD